MHIIYVLTQHKTVKFDSGELISFICCKFKLSFADFNDEFDYIYNLKTPK